MIEVNTKASDERVETLYSEAVEKVKKMAAQGFSSYRLDFKVVGREELDKILRKFESEHKLGIAYKGLTYNGYSGDFKSFTVKLC